jgi:NitT/TauT family transport system permease protein
MSPLRSLAVAFRPNETVNRQTMYIIVFVQVTVGLLVWMDSPFAVLPTPMEVIRSLNTLWFQEGLGRELWTSFSMNLQALGLTIAISLALSYLTVLPAFRPLAAAVTKGRFLGMMGLTFVFTLIVGGGHPLKLSLLVFGMTVFFTTSMASVVAEIPKDKFDHARTLRMSEWQVVWEVVILGTADEAIEILRQNAAIGWMMLTMVEGISRSEGGIGALLLNQSKHFRMAEVFAIQFVVLFVGVAQDYVIGLLSRRACPYAHLTLERR